VGRKGATVIDPKTWKKKKILKKKKKTFIFSPSSFLINIFSKDKSLSFNQPAGSL